MKFAQIEVVTSLLNSRQKDTSVRHVGSVEISIESATSKRALQHLLTAVEQSESHNFNASRLSISSATETARTEQDGFILSAALIHQVEQMTPLSPAGSALSFLQSALESLNTEISTQEARLTASKTKPEEARAIMLPRLALREHVRDCLAQYGLQGKSQTMAESLRLFEMQMSQGKFATAEQVAYTASKNAKNSFGRDHWWSALCRLWLSRAKRRQGQTAEADKLAASGEQALLEWTEQALEDSLFKDEVLKCRKCANPNS